MKFKDVKFIVPGLFVPLLILGVLVLIAFYVVREQKKNFAEIYARAVIDAGRRINHSIFGKMTATEKEVFIEGMKTLAVEKFPYSHLKKLKTVSEGLATLPDEEVKAFFDELEKRVGI